MKAAIFDLDDTLVDSFALHARSWVPVLERHDIRIEDLDRARYMGRRVKDICKMVAEEFGLETPYEELFEERMRNFLVLVHEELAFAHGAEQALGRCKAAGLATALATSGTREYVDAAHARLGLDFDAVVTGDDVTHGKPHPEVFLAAAEKLGVPAPDCVVFEDAALGVAAAKAAGCFCIGVRNPHHDADLSQADIVIESLAEFSPAMLLRGYVREEITFESAGAMLSGVLSVPPDATTCAIYLHGFSGNRSGTGTATQSALNEKGVATFRFDFFGHGESGGDFADITPSIGAQNAIDAFALMRARFDRVGAIGGSFGGYAAYKVAIEADPVFAVMRCPVANWNEKGLSMHVEDSEAAWRDKGWTTYFGRRLNYTFHEDASGASVYDELGKVRCPCLIVHGDADDVVPIEQSRKACRLIPDCALATIRGADHRFTGYFEKMLEAIVAFVEVHR